MLKNEDGGWNSVIELDFVYSWGQHKSLCVAAKRKKRKEKWRKPIRRGAFNGLSIVSGCPTDPGKKAVRCWNAISVISWKAGYDYWMPWIFTPVFRRGHFQKFLLSTKLTEVAWFIYFSSTSITCPYVLPCWTGPFHLWWPWRFSHASLLSSLCCPRNVPIVVHWV